MAINIKQLVKREDLGRYSNIYPKTYTESVKDKDSGKTLDLILVWDNFKYLSYTGSDYTTRLLIPLSLRRRGLWISYVRFDGTLVTEYYTSDVITDSLWGSSNNWTKYNTAESNSALLEEDDLSIEGGKLHFSNRKHNPMASSGKGYTILRKNIVGEGRANILTQNMISNEDTTYVIRYDYDLQGKTVTIPQGCILYFTGGSIDNGVLLLANTLIVYDGGTIFREDLSIRGTSLTDLSPMMVGLELDQDDGNNFERIRQVYTYANSTGVKVDWRGINSVHISKVGSPILLGKYNDFCNVIFNVLNTDVNGYMFTLKNVNEWQPLNVEASTIKPLLDGVDYSSISELASGFHLLRVTDLAAWTYRVSEPIYRLDLIAINDGVAYNKPIYNYNSNTSNPKLEIISVDSTPNVVKNLNINRLSGSTHITYGLSCFDLNNVVLLDISITTPKSSGLNNDAAITVLHCSNSCIDRVSINGIYDDGSSGYGFSLNNCYNTSFYNINTSNESWGVFGCNNMNTVYISNSNINRYDIHIYGRDVHFIDCSFKLLYNQFSSVFGNISFTNCTFIEFIPSTNGGSYNAWTEHTLSFSNCTIRTLGGARYLMDATSMTPNINTREELRKKYLPNVVINNLVIERPNNPMGVFNTTTLTGGLLVNIDYISINGLKFIEPNSECYFYMSVRRLPTLNAVRIDANNVFLIPEDDANISSLKGNYSRLDFYLLGSEDKLNTISIRNSRVGLGLVDRYDIVAEGCTILGDPYPATALSNLIYKNCKVFFTRTDINSLRSNYSFENCHITVVNTAIEIRFYKGLYKFTNCTKSGRFTFLPYGNDLLDELLGVTSYMVDDTEANSLNVLDDAKKMRGSTANRPALNSHYYASYYDTNLRKMIMWNGASWVDFDGLNIAKSGLSANRPTLHVRPGFIYFDTNLNKSIVWTGASWVNMDGTPLA